MSVVHVVNVRLCRSRQQNTIRKVRSESCSTSVVLIALCNEFSDGAEDKQTKQVCFACHFSAGIKILCSNTKALSAKLSMGALKTTVGSASLDGAEDTQKQVCCVCDFCAGIQILWSNTNSLNIKLSMAASKPIVGSASLDGAEDGPKIGGCCMRFFCKPLGIPHL